MMNNSTGGAFDSPTQNTINNNVSYYDKALALRSLALSSIHTTFGHGSQYIVSLKECNWVPALLCVSPKPTYARPVIRSHAYSLNSTRSSTERAGPRTECRGPLRPLLFSLCHPIEWMTEGDTK